MNSIIHNGILPLAAFQIATAGEFATGDWGAAPGSNRARRRFQYHLCHERLRCCLRRHLYNDLFVNLYAATTLADGNMTYLPDYFKTPQKISFETLEGIQDLK